MQLQTIIDILGKVFNTNFVVKRDLVTDPTFKAYKTYTISLYEVKKGEVPTPILNTQITGKIIDTNKEAMIEKAEKAFLMEVFKKYARYID